MIEFSVAHLGLEVVHPREDRGLLLLQRQLGRLHLLQGFRGGKGGGVEWRVVSFRKRLLLDFLVACCQRSAPVWVSRWFVRFMIAAFCSPRDNSGAFWSVYRARG